MFGWWFLDNFFDFFTYSQNVHCSGSCDSRATFALVQPIRHFGSLTPKIGLKCVGLPSSTRYANGWPHLQPRGRHFHCSGYFSLQLLYSICSLHFYALHKGLVSYCCHGHFADASRRYTSMNVRFRNKWWQALCLRQSLWDDVAFRTAQPIGGPSCLSGERIRICGLNT